MINSPKIDRALTPFDLDAHRLRCRSRHPSTRFRVHPCTALETPLPHTRPMPPGTSSGTTSAPASPSRLRTRPLSRDRGGDARSAALAESMEAHQRAISVHQHAMLCDIAAFSATEAFRGDGALSMAAWLTDRCKVSAGSARTLVLTAEKVGELPALSGALSAGRLTLDVLAPLGGRRHRRDRCRAGRGGAALERAPGQGAGPCRAGDGRARSGQDVHRALRSLRRSPVRHLGPAHHGRVRHRQIRPWSPGPPATTTPRPTIPTTSLSRHAWPTPWSRSASNGGAATGAQEMAGRGEFAAVAVAAVSVVVAVAGGGGGVAGQGGGGVRDGDRDDPSSGSGRPLFGGAPAHIVVHADLSLLLGRDELTGA